MENPSFSHRFHNFLGVSGSIILFAVIVAYARNPKWNGAANAPGPVSAGVAVETVALATPSLMSVSSIASNPEEAVPTVGPQLVAQGKTLYDSFCAACHGTAGKKRSPLLTGSDIFDDESAYGTDDGTMRRLIEEGIIDVGMVPWKSVLTTEQIDSLVAYIGSEHYTKNG